MRSTRNILAALSCAVAITLFATGAVTQQNLAVSGGVDIASAPANSTPVAMRGSEPPEPAEFVAGQILVRFTKSAGPAERTAARKRIGGRLKRDLGGGVQWISLPRGTAVAGARKRLEADDAVVYAEPNYVTRTISTPNDTLFGQQWGLNNTGQTVNGVTGTADADIDMPEGWDITLGGTPVVAVIDSGINYSHSDLDSNMWTNPGESGGGKQSNGVDDDGNGFIDDYRGWDYFQDDNDPLDENGHGTNVSGIIAAERDNASGIAGISPNAKIMNLRTQGPGGGGDMADMLVAIKYAAANGATVANMSLAAYGKSRITRDVIDSVPNLLIVAGAANDAINVDTYPAQPCAAPGDNVVCVAASDANDGLAAFSNYGATTVDLAAPGTNVETTALDGTYTYVGGTSFSTPHTAGVAALMRAYAPNATPAEIREALIAGADAKPAFAGKVVSGGRLNAVGALNAIKTIGATTLVSKQNGRLRVVSGSGITSGLSVTDSAGTITVQDAASLTAGAGCTAVNWQVVTCPSSGVSSIYVNGNDQSDSLVVSASLPATILGGDGGDGILGGSGNDTLIGGSGADTLSGGGGIDRADYSGRVNAVTVTIDNVASDGEPGEGDNVAPDVENLTGGGGADSLTGNSSANVIDGGPGNNTIDGGDGNDTLTSGLGNDIVTGGTGTDTVDYSDHEWYASVNVSLDGVANDGIGNWGFGGQNQIQINEFDNVGTDVENVTATDGSDTITGSAVANVINAGGGNDLIDPGLGADTVNGGAGTDTATYATRTANVTVTLDGSANDGVSGETDNIAADVENVTSGTGNDTLTGNGLDNVLTSGSGTDTLNGGARNDTLTGGLGTDTFVGGTGIDTVDYSERTVNVTVTVGSSANDGQSGEVENVPADVENVLTGTGNDSVTGSSADNAISTGAGTDTLNGSTGNDTLTPGSGTDTIVGGSGTDSLLYTDHTAVMNLSLDGVANDGEAGENENIPSDVEKITGGQGNDTITGNASANTLNGYYGDDTLNGAAGDDTLEGDAASVMQYDSAGIQTSCTGSPSGTDTLNGGDGNDRLTGSGGADVTNGGNNNDTVREGYLGDSLCYDGMQDSEADDVHGDAGTDTVDYAGELVNGVNVLLDDIANDGDVLNQVDNVHSDIENVVGSKQGDYLSGTNGPNVLSGNGGTGISNDLIQGNGGDDIISSPNSGSDVLDGGSGVDTIDYTTIAAGVTVDLANTGQQNTGGGGNDYVTTFENARGSAFNDTFTGTTGDNVFWGGNGADVFNGLAGTDTVRYDDTGRTLGVTVDIDGVADDGSTADGSGTKDNVKTDVENLFGTSLGDTLTGSTGGNEFNGGNGADVFNGLAGTDTVRYDDTGRTLGVTVDIDGVADDGSTADGSGTKDNVKTDVENLLGTSLNDTLSGGTGNNVLWGGLGADVFNGLGGTDTVRYDEANRTLGVTVDMDGVADDGSSQDSGADNVKTDVENLVGSLFGDILTGSTGNNSISGLAGVDTINGGNGNDAIDVNDDVNDNTTICGAGTDTVNADALPFDAVDATCEPGGVTRS